MEKIGPALAIWDSGRKLVTLQSYSADGNHVFDRDLVVLEFDSMKWSPCIVTVLFLPFVSAGSDLRLEKWRKLCESFSRVYREQKEAERKAAERAGEP